MSKARLEIRQAQPSDIAEIAELGTKVYVDFSPYPPSALRGQLNNYPEGCFVALLDEKIIG